MKISSRIENYIRGSVSAKFEPLYDEVRAKFHEADNEFEEIFQKTCTEAENMVIDLYIEHLGKFLSKEDIEGLRKEQEINTKRTWDTCSNGRRYRVSRFYWDVSSPLRKANNKLYDAESKAVNDICLALELGGTKADLERMLNELNPTLESLGIE